MVTRIMLVAMAFVMALGTATAQAAVTVQIDRPTVPVTDSLRVVFRVEGQSAGQPDFAPLEQDFEILGTSQSTSVSIVNGQMQQTASWTVDLMAKRTGELTIPPIEFGGETSPPRTVTVTDVAADPGGGGGEVFLEVEALPATPYVQALLQFTVRVFRAVQTSEASLTEPQIGGVDAVVERLGEDIGYETTRGGVRYAVVERRYGIFPQASGTLVIEPLLFEARLGRRTSIFDRFDSGRIVRVRSEPMEIEVLPIPADFRGQAWLPAERVQLTESWPGEADQWRAGEPVTRTLTLTARGLTASQLPEIGMRTPDGLKQYPDQPQLDTRVADQAMVGVRRETIALIPSQPGEYTLPAVEIPWWNTERDRMEVATLPARTVQVVPAPGATAASAPPATVAQPATVTADTPVVAPPETDARPWQWLSGGLAIGWLATIGAWWWRTRRRTPARPGTPERPQPVKPAVAAAALERACRAGDPHAAREALMQWAAARWPGNAVRSLGELAARLDGAIQAELHTLSRVLYSRDTTGWDGAALWDAFRSLRDEKPARRRRDETALEPLYRTQP